MTKDSRFYVKKKSIDASHYFINFASLKHSRTMDNQMYLYNTFSRRKELFEPLNPPFTGLYVCGPTVYSDPNLGHDRVNTVFDILYRYLHHLGYRVRNVRNITDVGDLECSTMSMKYMGDAWILSFRIMNAR